jgi:hypothetical protein
MPKKSKGRRKGSRNKGYFYRTSHKVWVAQEGKRFVPLVDESGDPYCSLGQSFGLLRAVTASLGPAAQSFLALEIELQRIRSCL